MVGTILKPLHEKLVKRSVKDVLQFVDKIKSANTLGLKMMSLDVTSIFTNIPLIETVEYICEQLIENEIETTVPINVVKELLLKCTMNVNFKFNREIFRQTDGVAMGSPLGPILADIFIAKLENGPLKKIIQKFTFYCRYMDDTFILCIDNVSQQDVLRQFNEVHPSIQLTSGEESDGRIAFLDVLLTKRADGSLKRNLNKKIL